MKSRISTPFLQFEGKGDAAVIVAPEKKQETALVTTKTLQSSIEKEPMVDRAIYSAQELLRSHLKRGFISTTYISCFHKVSDPKEAEERCTGVERGTKRKKGAHL